MEPMKHTIEYIPRDLLFLRDARPMEAADAGLGANWPRPDQFYHSLLSSFRLRWPVVQEWEKPFLHQGAPRFVDNRFGTLQTKGPFPKKDGNVFFPRPLDLGMHLVKAKNDDEEGTDLPSFLKYAFRPWKEGKTNPPRWVSGEIYKRYLQDVKCEELYRPDELGKDSSLYDVERQFGIGIEPGRGTVRDGDFYQAEYLRLGKDVTLVCEATCETRSGNGKEKKRDAFDSDQTHDERIERAVLGGQQGVCSVKISNDGLPFPEPPEEHWKKPPTLFVRWTLLTPAVFQAGREPEANSARKQEDPVFGWIPAWCLRTDADRVYRDEIGKVMLPRSVKRDDGESRQEWKVRQKAAGTIGAKLVAARIDKPFAFSGWNLPTATSPGGPKPTMLAVPAGSCYVFECDSPGDASDLFKALHLVPRSDLLGSNGFGIGVCSFIEAPTTD